MTVPTSPQNSISVCQSRPLRASREASIANTAPTRPSQIADSKRSKPGRLILPPEPPRSSRRTVTDKRVLKLIRAFLKSGVTEDGLVSPVDEGTPQAGPL